MNFLNAILGRAKPTPLNITRLLAEAGADLEANRLRLTGAETALLRVAVLTAAEHAAAEMDEAEARRAILRAEARIAELQAGLVEAQAVERRDELNARAETVRRRVEVDASKALDRYERAGSEVAAAVDEFSAIAEEVDALNNELRTAGLSVIETPHRRHRCTSGAVTAEVRSIRKKWVRRVPVPVTDGNGKSTGYRMREEDAGAISFKIVNGKHVPDGQDLFEVEYEHVEPERRDRDSWLPSLSHTVALPPARPGRDWLFRPKA